MITKVLGQKSSPSVDLSLKLNSSSWTSNDFPAHEPSWSFFNFVKLKFAKLKFLLIHASKTKGFFSYCVPIFYFENIEYFEMDVPSQLSYSPYKP